MPDYLRPIMWSYDFSSIDVDKNKKAIIINAINYGDLKHWRWLKATYGVKELQKILGTISVTELRPSAFRLASILFSINKFNYAPRGVK